jgi:sodium-dependent phosphate transporter
MCIASVMEFAGAMLVGSRVTDTIRTKVISTKLFESDPSVLMLAMTCAIVGSATYLTIATRFTMPVSTTHSIMGGVIGVGIASAGTKGVNWSFKGVSQVFAAWGIAPAISAGFGAIIFLITKHGVMRRNNPVKKAFIMVPLYCKSRIPLEIREATLTLHHSLPDIFLVGTAHRLEGRLSQD